VVIDDTDKRIYEKRLPNDLDAVHKALLPFKESLRGVAVESTFNWYWLVDGLMDKGYPLQLVNTAQVKQYEGLKHTDDPYDAYWLAHLMRLGILPTGYIYPKEERAIRDLLRKRGQLVNYRISHILSSQNIYWRNTGQKLPADDIKHGTDYWQDFENDNTKLALSSHAPVIESLNEQIGKIERAVLKQSRLRPEFQKLTTVNGIGKILARKIHDIHFKRLA